MIQLKNDTLAFSFPQVHEDASLQVHFQRTLRIPDDDNTYPLPPGLGRFPLRHVDDFEESVPATWKKHGGVMLPMYSSEAMWIRFSSRYPFAIKVAAGKINAVTGDPWQDGLNREPQDYLVSPDQPWLDGYCVGEGVIRQFVAMPMGSGYSVEAQLTGEEVHGGLQIIAYPLKAAEWEKYLARQRSRNMYRGYRSDAVMCADSRVSYCAAPDMALGAGGQMKQEIFTDRRSFEDWDLNHSSRCFVHLADAMVWRHITGEDPPTVPPTSKEYEKAGLPWFDYYGGDEATALPGTEKLGGVKSVGEIGDEKGETPLPENEPVNPETVVKLGGKEPADLVRDGEF